MKRIFAVLLVAVVLAAFAAGCNNDPAPSSQPPTSPQSTPPVYDTPASNSPSPGDETPFEPASPDPKPVNGPIMISAEELNALMGDENLIIVGVISPSAALVPFSNAANPVNGSYLVWTGDFLASGNDEALSTEIGLFRPKLADMETLMSKAGAMQDSLIVVYSSDWLSQGARVAWNLSMLGLNVRFLDGGVEAWRAIHGRTGNSKRLPDQSIKTDFRAPNYSPGACDVSIDMVIEALQNPDEWVVIDTRDLAEYEGKKTDSSGGAYGTGRMKGAVHIQWETAQDSKGKLLSRDELMGIYGFIGDRKVIVFCQGGVRSAYTWIVLKDLGFDVYNYDGSWLEWSYAVSDYSSYPKDVVLGLTEEWKDYGKPI